MAKARGPAEVYQLKITPRDIKPPVWRRVQVKDGTLGKLHAVIQACMGWTNSHLHAFDVGGQQYGEPDPDGMLETADERKVKLSQVVARGHKKFSYTYDFGDSWDHTIQVEKVLDPEPGVRYPRCVAGKRACPPEDCGGPCSGRRTCCLPGRRSGSWRGAGPSAARGPRPPRASRSRPPPAPSPRRSLPSRRSR